MDKAKKTREIHVNQLGFEMRVPPKKRKIAQLGLLGVSIIGLLFAIPRAGQEIKANAARNALADLTAAGPSERDAALRAAEQVFATPVNLGEWNDLAAQFALLQQPMDMDRAEELTWAALERSPARAESWARLAYIELLREGKLTQKSFEYLERSFVVEPAGYRQFMNWRLNFMFTYWSQLPTSLQNMTMRSFRMLAIRRDNDAAMREVETHNNAQLTERAKQALRISDEQ